MHRVTYASSFLLFLFKIYRAIQVHLLENIPLNIFKLNHSIQQKGKIGEKSEELTKNMRLTKANDHD